LHPDKTVENIYNENKNWFSLFFRHFAIDTYHPYLHKFASVKAQDQTISGNKTLLKQYWLLEKFNIV